MAAQKGYQGKYHVYFDGPYEYVHGPYTEEELAGSYSSVRNNRHFGVYDTIEEADAAIEAQNNWARRYYSN